MPTQRLLVGDARDRLAELPERSVHCVVTSPPYWGLRDYGVAGQLGLEPVPDCLGWATGNACGECYVCHLVAVFRGVWRALRDDGTAWLNLGDSFANDGKWGGATGGKHVADGQTGGEGYRLRRRTGLKPKDLCMIPARVALALQADGWTLRSEIIWSKKSCMPESVRDRPTRAHEQVFLLSKRARYYYDAEAVAETTADANAQRTTGHYRTDERYGARNGGNSGLDGLAAKMRDGSHTTRNMRSVWTLGPEPFPASHFAVYPTEIPRRAILAGTSERGVCPACGAPWVRVVERKGTMAVDEAAIAAMEANGVGCQKGNLYQPHGAGFYAEGKTLGWSPTCPCDAGDPIPATVLDPFAGAGTTGLVADRLGRSSILVELNPEYAAMAKARIYGDAPLFANVAD